MRLLFCLLSCLSFSYDLSNYDYSVLQSKSEYTYAFNDDSSLFHFNFHKELTSSCGITKGCSSYLETTSQCVCVGTLHDETVEMFNNELGLNFTSFNNIDDVFYKSEILLRCSESESVSGSIVFDEFVSVNIYFKSPHGCPVDSHPSTATKKTAQSSDWADTFIAVIIVVVIVGFLAVIFVVLIKKRSISQNSGKQEYLSFPYYSLPQMQGYHQRPVPHLPQQAEAFSDKLVEYHIPQTYPKLSPQETLPSYSPQQTYSPQQPFTPQQAYSPEQVRALEEGYNC